MGKSAFETIDKVFGAALTTHLILCDWLAENWRWYTEFVEERFEKLTGEKNSPCLPDGRAISRARQAHRP